MMALPNSRFAEMLRRNVQRRGNNSNWGMGTQEAGAATALSLAPFKSTVDSYSDEFSQVMIFFFILNLFFCTLTCMCEKNNNLEFDRPFFFLKKIAQCIEFGYKSTAIFKLG